MVVHFILIEGDTVQPLCGDWAGSPSWSKIRGAVTCPRCLELLERPAHVLAVG